jgi:hypothetical protein
MLAVRAHHAPMRTGRAISSFEAKAASYRQRLRLFELQLASCGQAEGAEGGDAGCNDLGGAGGLRAHGDQGAAGHAGAGAMRVEDVNQVRVRPSNAYAASLAPLRQGRSVPSMQDLHNSLALDPPLPQTMRAGCTPCLSTTPPILESEIPRPRTTRLRHTHELPTRQARYVLQRTAAAHCSRLSTMHHSHPASKQRLCWCPARASLMPTAQRPLPPTHCPSNTCPPCDMRRACSVSSSSSVPVMPSSSGHSGWRSWQGRPTLCCETCHLCKVDNNS